MASFKCSISFDSYDSRKLNFNVCSSNLSDRCSIPAFTGYAHVSGASIIHPFYKLKQIRASRLNTELLDISEFDSSNGSVSESLASKDPNPRGDFQRGRRNIWKSFRGVKKATSNEKLEHNSRSNRNKHEKEQESRADSLSTSEELFDFDLSTIRPDSSLEYCNGILKNLEKGNDGQALRFFEWMREKGKLNQNVTAYKLGLRVLGRRQDWDRAESVITEMTSASCCELSISVFNTLIYACHKQGNVKIGTKWFRMMLEKSVRPNAATFGMLMNLYQKGLVVEEAEFTFSQMRNFKVICQSAYSAMVTIYTRLGLFDKAEEVIGFLREDKVTLNLENWLVVLNAYSQQGKLNEAEMVLVSMRKAGFSPHIVAYNTMITGYGKVSNMGGAQRLFRALTSVGLEPDETTYRSMIEGWGRVGNYKEAEWYYKELKRSGFNPNSSNLYTMINLQAMHGDEEGAIRIIDDMMVMGCQYSSILSILLQAYERAGKFEKVPLVLTGLFYEHVLVNQTSCSILVMGYVKHGLVDDAIEVLDEKRWEDQIFEDNLYHLLICTCKELSDLENAVKIYTSMPKSHKPNLHITCTMIDIYSVMKLFDEAKSLYLKLKSSGIALDMIAFSVVVRLYVQSGSLEDAYSVLDTMDKQKNVVPDVFLLRDMLRIYQRLSMLDKLSDLYYKILKNGVPWDQEMYNCVINCCARALPVDELSRLFDEMLGRGFTPNTITFNVMLDVYGKSRLFKKARRVFWIAKKRGLVDIISYNTLVAAYGQNRDFRNMSSTVKKMQFNGFSVSLEAYNCMLDAYGKEGEMDKFKDVLKRMKESSCASDRYTYNIMINIYGDKGWIEEVANVLTELKECGLGPDLYSYNTLIKAYGIAGLVEDAVCLVKEMRKNGIEPDRFTYNNLIIALQKNDKVLEAVKWSLWMKQIGM